MRSRLTQFLIYAVLTAVLAAGVASAATSSASRVRRAPALRKSPTVSGKTEVGDVLHAHTGRWTAARTLTISWERCGRKGRACRLIGRLKKTAGDSGKTYKLSGADVGHRIRVLVSRATLGDTRPPLRMTPA